MAIGLERGKWHAGALVELLKADTDAAQHLQARQCEDLATRRQAFDHHRLQARLPRVAIDPASLRRSISRRAARLRRPVCACRAATTPTTTPPTPGPRM